MDVGRFASLDAHGWWAIAALVVLGVVLALGGRRRRSGPHRGRVAGHRPGRRRGAGKARRRI